MAPHLVYPSDHALIIDGQDRLDMQEGAENRSCLADAASLVKMLQRVNQEEERALLVQFLKKG
ncbi:hypothetical protein D3C73_1674050 [compost metagenome]